MTPGHSSDSQDSARTGDEGLELGRRALQGLDQTSRTLRDEARRYCPAVFPSLPRKVSLAEADKAVAALMSDLWEQLKAETARGGHRSASIAFGPQSSAHGQSVVMATLALTLEAYPLTLERGLYLPSNRYHHHWAQLQRWAHSSGLTIWLEQLPQAAGLGDVNWALRYAPAAWLLDGIDEASH